MRSSTNHERRMKQKGQAVVTEVHVVAVDEHRGELPMDGIVSVMPHGAELVETEWLAIAPETFLDIENRPRAGSFDQQGDDQEDRQQREGEQRRDQ